jgi:hypothetical protein
MIYLKSSQFIFGGIGLTSSLIMSLGFKVILRNVSE